MGVSNPLHFGCKPNALPIELIPRLKIKNSGKPEFLSAKIDQKSQEVFDIALAAFSILTHI